MLEQVCALCTEYLPKPGALRASLDLSTSLGLHHHPSLLMRKEVQEAQQAPEEQVCNLLSAPRAEPTSGHCLGVTCGHMDPVAQHLTTEQCLEVERAIK